MLLLGLLLLTAACKKDAVEPEPSLEGRWIEYAHLGYPYDKSGKFLKELSYTPPTPTYGTTIHPTAFEWIAKGIFSNLSVFETGDLDNALAKRRRAFAQICGLLAEHGVPEPEQLSVFQFQSRLDFVTAKMKRIQ